MIVYTISPPGLIWGGATLPIIRVRNGYVDPTTLLRLLIYIVLPLLNNLHYNNYM